MALFPFKNNGTQKVISAIVIIIGILLIISPTTVNIWVFNINTFIVGVIVTFFGGLYLIDIL